MRNRLLTALLAVALGAAMFAVGYQVSADRALHQAAQAGDAMGWLRVEFGLSAEQERRIQALHVDYSVACGEHCHAILEARRRGAPPAEVAALEKVCVDAMTAHFRAVAALMPAGQGERYLAVVLPRIAGYDHHGAPSVRGTP